MNRLKVNGKLKDYTVAPEAVKFQVHHAQQQQYPYLLL